MVQAERVRDNLDLLVRVERAILDLLRSQAVGQLLGQLGSPSFQRLHVIWRMQAASYASACAEGQRPAAPRGEMVSKMTNAVFFASGHVAHNEAFSVQSS